MLQKLKNVVQKILKKPIQTKSYGQLLLTDKDEADWVLTLTDPMNNPKLFLTYPTRDKARNAKKAIELSHQVYEVSIERKEIS